MRRILGFPGLMVLLATVVPAVEGPLPPAALPSVPHLEDLLRDSTGQPIRDREAWRRRRAEIADLLLRYQYGTMPPPPDQVTARLLDRRPHPRGPGTQESLSLRIGSRDSLEMRVLISRPVGPGPFPALILESGRPGSTPQVSLFLEAGYLFVEYARHELDPDRPRVAGPAQQKYPDHDWATLAVWAWGGHRVVDYLLGRDDVDPRRIGITGHSRGGKMALLAGALDERISLVAPCASGSGGAGSHRLLGPGAESLAMNDKPHWYLQGIQQFDDQEDRLPFDQHHLKALVAPRALLCTESIDDEFANPEGTQATSMAAQPVFELLGVPRHNGLYFRRGSHDRKDEDWQALLEFSRRVWFPDSAPDDSRFWQTPFPLPESLVPGATLPPVERLEGETVEPSEIDLEWTRVGHPGNDPDLDHEGRGRFGSVAYSYEITTRQITLGQYSRFLEAVARHDEHGLYHPHLGGSPGGIIRSGSPGSHRYRVLESRRKEPVRLVSHASAARFVNWLHHGQPSSAAGPGVTEDGAYPVTGRDVGPRQPGARFSLPSDDEWYKAVYHRPSGGEGESTYENFIPRDRGGFEVARHSRDRITPAGLIDAHDPVWEWTEDRVGSLFRGLRSGAWFLGNNRQSAGRFSSPPDLAHSRIGFRVVRHVELSALDLPRVRVSRVRRVRHETSEAGHHEAFTDLIRFRDRFYLTFRSCPDGHGVHSTSSIVVLESEDLETWKSVHRFSVPRRDTRDPHFLHFRDRLFVYTGTWYRGEADARSFRRDLNLHLGYAVWSRDGETWEGPTPLEGTFGHYVWRASAHDGRAYLCARRNTDFWTEGRGDRTMRQSRMLESEDGLIWRDRGAFQERDGDETAFQFLEDGRLLAVARRGRGPAELIRSRPPYRKFERVDLDRYLGGPLLVRWGNHWLVGGRVNTADGPRTELAWLVRDELHAFAHLPSGGDNSYPGFIDLGDGRAVVSWYSTHEKDPSGRPRTAIYLADLDLEP